MNIDKKIIDSLIREPATENPENLSLEILIHFVNKYGKRMRPFCNRITIHLQVPDITKTESVMFPMWLEKSVTSCIRDHELLHRWVRDPKMVEMLKESGNNTYHKLLELACATRIDCIESLYDNPHKGLIIYITIRKLRIYNNFHNTV